MEKLQTAFGKDVLHAKGFFRTNKNRRNESFLYVIVSEATFNEFRKMEFEANGRDREYSAFEWLSQRAKFFRTQPQAVRFIESL
ncbi:MAG: hypothetical protein IIW53_04585 [Rikenellaceae bacterium]|nr:hypothetical protein [Rikenellaceae bacterium]MBQ5853352.1 hypothetical protein [Rikenellaceae bacterium]